MNFNLEADESFIRPEKRMPERYERVIVVCSQFRRLGYLDKEGVWRADHTDEELKNVVGWLP